MSFEDTLRREIGLALEAVPAQVSHITDIASRGRRRRRRNKLGRLSVAAVLAAATVAMVSPQIFGFTFGEESDSVTVAGREMPYTEVLSEEPLIVRGETAEAPRFNTSTLGPEIPFEATDLPDDLPTLLSGGGVFAGSVNGISVYIYGDRIAGDGAFCVTTGGDSICGNATLAGSGGGASSEYDSTGGVAYGIVVGDIPSTVSVVAYYTSEDEQPFAWQRPVAYASYMPVDSDDDYEENAYWQFYDAEGFKLDSAGNR